MALAGCTLLAGLSDKQCEQDSDCVTPSFSGQCTRNVCVARTESDSGEPEGSCQTDDDCEDQLPACFKDTCVSSAVAETWICETLPESESSVVHYGFHVVEFLSREPPANMVVRACRNNDVACTDPVGSFTDTTGDGYADFDLPNGFAGFFEINSDALQSLLYVTEPIVRDSQNRDVPVLDPSTVTLTATIAGFDYDETKGLAILEALDCTGNPAGGVHFTASREDADSFYIVDQVPSREAEITAYDAATNTADGGFINVSTGFVTFSAYLGVDGIELGAFNAQIRANTITFIDMHF